MAYLRRHKRSPFLFLVARNLETGEWEEKSTKLRADLPKDARKALRQADAATAREALVRPTGGGDFHAWVPGYIAQHFRVTSSRDRYTTAWVNISEWLRLRNIKHPGSIRYEHWEDYMAWRKQAAKHNTARLEFKFLSHLMRESVKRELIEKNPFQDVRVDRDAPTEKVYLTDELIQIARNKFAQSVERKLGGGDTEWMAVTFEILISIGCRFAEASIPMDRVDLVNKKAMIEDSKRKVGDPRKFFHVDLSDDLVEYLKGLSPRERTVPKLMRAHNTRFNDMLKRVTGATSHSCRVTFIHRCQDAGLSEQQTMALVNHSDRLVHQIYSRKRLMNLQEARKKVMLPPRIPLPKKPESIESSSSSRKKGRPSRVKN